MLATAIALASLPSVPAFAQDGDNGIEEMVVTGSRIAVDNATQSSSPVSVIGGGEIRTAGQVDLGELLRESPALNNSLPASFSAFTDAGLTDSDLGLGLLDLRGLGTVRTLVLVNGRRHVAGGQGSAAVDVNSIPSVLVKRVETLTGGASSIYGSDAVTGVVNFVTRKGGDFDGVEFTAQTGMSSEGDSEEYLVSAGTGFEFSDGRGEAVFAFEYLQNEEVFDFERSFTGPFIGSEIENSPEIAAALGIDPGFSRAYVRNTGNPISSPFGVFDLTTIDSFGSIDAFISDNPAGTAVPTFPGTSIPVLQVVQDPVNGVPKVYDPGLAPNTSESLGVGDGLGNQLGTLLPEQDRISLNLNGSYEIASGISFFVETKYVNSENSERVGTADFNDAIPIAYDNPYIPTALAGQIAELQGLGLIEPDPMDPDQFYGFGASRDTSDLAVLPRTTVERETIRTVFGLEGEIPVLDGVGYELSYNYGRTEAEINNLGTRLEDRFYAALDTVVDPASGEIVCRSDLDSTALPWVGAAFPTPEFSSGNFTSSGRFDEFVSFTPGDGQCVPFNPFGRNASTEDYASFVYVNARDRVEVEQNVLLATVNGSSSSLFELPGGPIGWAAGLEYREEESEFEVSEEELSQNTWAGSRGTASNSVVGDYDVFDYFFEVQAPLLANLPLVEYLEVTGSMRFSDYSTIGESDAWSVGGRWSPIAGVTLRSSYSEAVRAPNIGELFSPRQPDTFRFLDDPCSIQNIENGSDFRVANCAEFVPEGYDVTNFITAGIPGVTGGNPDLSEEEAQTLTYGLVLESPSLLPGFRMMVDYYEIEIEGAIASLDPEDIAAACVDLPSTGNQFCDLIQRDPTQGFITFHESGQVNLGAFETSGVDFSTSYSFAIADLFSSSSDFGFLSLRATGTHLLDYDEFQDPVDTSVVRDRVEEFGFPEWILNLRADWSYGDLTLSLASRFETSQLLSGIENSDLDANPMFVNRTDTGDSWVHDLNFSYAFTDKVDVYGGLNNALDEEPYLGTLSRPAGPRGRFFFAGVNWRL